MNVLLLFVRVDVEACGRKQRERRRDRNNHDRMLFSTAGRPCGTSLRSPRSALKWFGVVKCVPTSVQAQDGPGNAHWRAAILPCLLWTPTLTSLELRERRWLWVISCPPSVTRLMARASYGTVCVQHQGILRVIMFETGNSLVQQHGRVTTTTIRNAHEQYTTVLHLMLPQRNKDLDRQGSDMASHSMGRSDARAHGWALRREGFGYFTLHGSTCTGVYPSHARFVRSVLIAGRRCYLDYSRQQCALNLELREGRWLSFMYHSCIPRMQFHRILKVRKVLTIIFNSDGHFDYFEVMEICSRLDVKTPTVPIYYLLSLMFLSIF